MRITYQQNGVSIVSHFLGVLMSGQLGMDSIIVKRVVEPQGDWNSKYTFKRVKVKKKIMF